MHARSCACASRGAGVGFDWPRRLCIYYGWPAAEAESTDLPTPPLYALAKFVVTHDRARTKLRADAIVISIEQVNGYLLACAGACTMRA